MRKLEIAITHLADEYQKKLKVKIDERVEEMNQDNVSHYLLYEVLGISRKEGEKIDIYQNIGRFLYKYAGSFLEEAAILCFEHKYQNAKRKVRIENTIGPKPKTFEIDCLVDHKAYEIKWRDATTDGDHITKEHARVAAIKGIGLIPIRIMFYRPNRDQAIRIQERLKILYNNVDGQYYSGEDAWKYMQRETGVDMEEMLKQVTEIYRKH